MRPVALGLLRDTPTSSTSVIKKTQENTEGESGPSGDGTVIKIDLGGVTNTEKGFDVSELEQLQT